MQMSKSNKTLETVNSTTCCTLKPDSRLVSPCCCGMQRTNICHATGSCTKCPFIVLPICIQGATLETQLATRCRIAVLDEMAKDRKNPGRRAYKMQRIHFAQRVSVSWQCIQVSVTHSRYLPCPETETGAASNRQVSVGHKSDVDKENRNKTLDN